MRTVTFQSVLNGVCRRAGLDPTTLDANTALQIAEYIQEWAKKCWEWEFWPEITPIEQRAYRDTYNPATAYAAGALNAPVEVWFPAAQMYAQTLQATTGNAPFVSVNGVWVANSPYWEMSQCSYSGNPWATGKVYTQGTPGTPGIIVQNPADENFYECIVTHTSGATFDPTKFAILTTFERYVSLDQTNQTPIGEVSMVSRSNPRTNPKFTGRLKFLVNDHGILPAPNAGVLVWVLFRLRPPQFTTTAYASGTTYGLNAVVYQPSTTGECYVSLVAGNVGQTPETSPTKWQKQNVLFVISEAIKQGAYAELLRADGQNERADDQEEEAKAKLMEASDVVLASQGQYDRADAQVYC